MKKLFLISFSLFLVFSFNVYAASPSWSVGDSFSLSDSDSDSDALNTNDIKFSSGVSYKYDGSDSVYVAATKNTEAEADYRKVYASSSEDSVLYSADDGDSGPSLPSAGSDISWASDTWNEVGK